MGLTYSPYHACQAVTWAKSVSLGDRLNLSNTFILEKVVVKFPGKTVYDC